MAGRPAGREIAGRVARAVSVSIWVFVCVYVRSLGSNVYI